MKKDYILGIDIGGTGIKGGVVDLKKGEIIGEKFRKDTPHPATMPAIMEVIKELIHHFDWKGDIGVGYPGVIVNQEILTAANLDKSLIGSSLSNEIKKVTKKGVYTLNDADAAGIAEMHYGVGEKEKGVVLMVTLGTGIGTALFMDGVLVPNTELGHIYLKKGDEAEEIAAGSAKKRLDLSWKKWSKNVLKFLKEMERLLYPDLFILGGGMVKEQDKFLHLLETRAEIRIAEMENNAGIVGAALAGHIYLK